MKPGGIVVIAGCSQANEEYLAKMLLLIKLLGVPVIGNTGPVSTDMTGDGYWVEFLPGSGHWKFPSVPQSPK